MLRVILLTVTVTILGWSQASTIPQGNGPGGGASIASTSEVLKGNGGGNGVAATPGTDFSKPNTTETTSGGRTFTGAVDVSGATSSKPMKSGTTPPATCAVGEMFQDTDATSGYRILICESTDTWVAQGGGPYTSGVGIEIVGNQIAVDSAVLPVTDIQHSQIRPPSQGGSYREMTAFPTGDTSTVATNGIRITYATGGSRANSLVTTTSTTPYMHDLSTGTTINTPHYGYSPVDARVLRTDNLIMEWAGHIQVAEDDAARFMVGCGGISTTVLGSDTPTTDWVGFRRSRDAAGAGDTNWMAVYCKSGVGCGTATDTGYTATAYRKLMVTVVGTVATWYVDGTQVHTVNNAAELPLSTGCQPLFGVQNVAAEAKSLRWGGMWIRMEMP